MLRVRWQLVLKETAHDLKIQLAPWFEMGQGSGSMGTEAYVISITYYIHPAWSCAQVDKKLNHTIPIGSVKA